MRFGQKPVQRFGSDIFILKLLQAFALLSHKLRVGKVRLTNLFIHLTAAFLVLVSVAENLVDLGVV